MPIVTSDIKIYLSGGAGNANPNASLGGVRSTTQLVDATLHNLFDPVSSAEAAAGSIEYRCVYVRNEHATLTWIDPRAFIDTESYSADTTIHIGLGTAAINATEQTVANETTAPSGVTFAAPETFAAGLVVTDLAPSAFKAVWVRRTVTAGAAVFADGFVMAVQGDTAP
jgi:hypothetical protein